MPFINNKRYKVLIDAKNGGDEKAKAIIDAYMGGNCAQVDLDGMVSGYFDPKEEEAKAMEAIAASNADDAASDAPIAPEAEPNAETPTDAVGAPDAMVDNVESTLGDIFSDLDKELEGCIDEPSLKDETFDDFLKKKRSDAMRMRKDAQYFKAFDEAGRSEYLRRKKEEFSGKFDTSRKDIERSFNDMDKAISSYADSVSMFPDDGMETDMDSVGKAYDGLVDMKDKTHSFGRPWDDDDTAEIIEGLKELASRYGKKNVWDSLNVMKSHNGEFRDMRNGRIDQAIADYGKSLDKLLGK